MKKIALLSLLVLACASPTAENPKPSLDDQHALPHNGPCHAGETETQGQGGVVTCSAA
jgi:hypothetical protein